MPTGKGNKIIRVEISLDDGKSWRLADIRRFEKPNAYGKPTLGLHCPQSVTVAPVKCHPPRSCPFPPDPLPSSFRQVLVLGPLGHPGADV